jgi:hypothetical protein
VAGSGEPFGLQASFGGDSLLAGHKNMAGQFDTDGRCQGNQY